jgi:hypothetical protein
MNESFDSYRPVTTATVMMMMMMIMMMMMMMMIMTTKMMKITMVGGSLSNILVPRD